MSETLVMVLDFLEVFIAMVFYINMNKCKYRLPVVVLVWSALTVVFLLATNSIRPLALIRGPFHLASNFVLSLFLFSGKWYKKLLVVIYHVAILFVGELLALQLYIALYGSPQKDFFAVERVLCTIFYIIFFAILASVVVIINKRVRGRQMLLSLGLQFIVDFSFLALVFMCFFENSSGILENQLVFLLSVSIPIIIVNLFMFSVIDGVSKISIREKELEFIESKNKDEYAYYKLALESEKKISEMRHDMANYMQIATKLSEDGFEEGKQLLEAFNRSYPKPLRYCDSEIVNTVLALKSAEMERAGIDAQIEMLSAFSSSPYSDLELSSILSNLIDNAIRGCEGFSGEKKMKIAVGVKQNHFIIMVENTSDESFDPEEVTTTKENADRHGLGLKIIRKTVSKYGGSFTISKSENVIRALAVAEMKN